MNLEEVLADTRRAYAEAGESDPDLSYITQDYLDDMQANADEVDGAEPAPIQSGETEATLQPLWGNLYYNVTFAGMRFYGQRGGESYVCGGNWNQYGGWRQRALVGRCRNSSALIWRIG